MPILAEEDVDGDYWKEAVPDVSDVYYATYASIYGDDPDPAVNEMVERYQEKEGKLPETSAFLTGYALVQAVATAVEGTGGSTDGTELQEQLETFDEEPLLLTDDVQRQIPHHPQPQAAGDADPGRQDLLRRRVDPEGDPDPSRSLTR